MGSFFSIARSSYGVVMSLTFCIVSLSFVSLLFVKRRQDPQSHLENIDTAQASHSDDVGDDNSQAIAEKSRHSAIEVHKPEVKPTTDDGEKRSAEPFLFYHAGNTIRLEVTKQSKSHYVLPTMLEATILNIVEPVTFSPVMKVLVKDASGCEKIAILKLFDRRYMPDYRSAYDKKFPPWDLARENEYRQAVKSGQVAAYVQWQDAREREDNSDDFDPRMGNQVAQEEADVYRQSVILHAHELAVYECLEDLQGRDIPQLFASVRVDQSTFDPTIPTDGDAKYFEVQGLLMEYIDGFPLSDLGDHASSESWQLVVDDAIDIVNRITDHDILNDDVQTRNVLVRKANNDAGHKAIMIDFSIGKFRDPNVPDLEWREAKYRADEEGSIGPVMEWKLKKIKPGIVTATEKYGQASLRWLGLHTFESPRKYQEWLLTDKCMVQEQTAIDALEMLDAEGLLIAPIEEFGIERSYFKGANGGDNALYLKKALISSNNSR